MSTIQFAAPDTEENLLTTELNSMIDGDRVISAAFSNDAGGERYLTVDFKLDLAVQGSARSAGPSCQLWILYAIDGTGYTYGDASLEPPPEASKGVFTLDPATNARIVHMTDILLRPYNFKVVLENNTGQTLASSGTILSMRRVKLENV